MKSIPIPKVRRKFPDLFATQLPDASYHIDNETELNHSPSKKTKRKPYVPKYLDWGHDFVLGYFVYDKNLTKVYAYQDRVRFEKLWSERNRPN